MIPDDGGPDDEEPDAVLVEQGRVHPLPGLVPVRGLVEHAVEILMTRAPTLTEEPDEAPAQGRPDRLSHTMGA